MNPLYQAVTPDEIPLPPPASPALTVMEMESIESQRCILYDNSANVLKLIIFTIIFYHHKMFKTHEYPDKIDFKSNGCIQVKKPVEITSGF